MKKFLLPLIICALLLVSCNGSGGEEANTSAQTNPPETTVTEAAPAEIDINSLAADAVSKISFGMTVEELSSDAVDYLYPGLPEGTEGVVYATGGAGAEELAVFRCSDGDALSAVIESHREDQRTAYASYKPEDVAKIDNAVTYRKGEYTVFCISSDRAEAKKVIEGLLG